MIRIDNGDGGRWAILVAGGVLIRLRSLSEARRRMRESADPLNPYKCVVRRWRKACKRVALIERINDERFKWRNWSDEVAPPFGSDRDRSDEGQRKAISAQLAKRDAEVGRLQLLLACATRERDLRIERAVATAKQRDSALADVERMRAVFEAAVRWRAARRARHDASVQHEVMPWHRVECTQSEDALMDAIDTDTKAGAR